MSYDQDEDLWDFARRSMSLRNRYPRPPRTTRHRETEILGDLVQALVVMEDSLRRRRSWPDDQARIRMLRLLLSHGNEAFELVEPHLPRGVRRLFRSKYGITRELLPILARSVSEKEEEPREEKGPSRSALRMVRLASAVDVEPVSRDEWRAHLHGLAETGSRAEIARFVAGVVLAGVRSRAGWLLRKAAAPLLVLLCWWLRSDARTWTTLSGLLLWAGVETAGDTGVGAAIVLVVASYGALAGGVKWLRDRFGAHPPDKSAD